MTATAKKRRPAEELLDLAATLVQDATKLWKLSNRLAEDPQSGFVMGLLGKYVKGRHAKADEVQAIMEAIEAMASPEVQARREKAGEAKARDAERHAKAMRQVALKEDRLWEPGGERCLACADRCNEIAMTFYAISTALRSGRHGKAFTDELRSHLGPLFNATRRMNRIYQNDEERYAGKIESDDVGDLTGNVVTFPMPDRLAEGLTDG